MLTRLVFLISMVLVVTVFLTGAWPGPLGEAPPNPEPAYLAQSARFGAATEASALDGNELLRKAANALHWRSTPWLKTKIRHRTIEPNTNSVVEGFLQRGPNHCARLELSLAGGAAKLTLVSDGKVIAQARQVSNQTAEVVVERLVEDSPDETAPDEDAKEETLDRKGCGGPGALLARIGRALRGATAKTGMLDGKGVIRIAGEVDACDAPVAPAPIGRCRVYLDARTLWPWRVEWLAQATDAARPVLRVEFLDPEIGHALGDADCIRLFSYTPQQPPTK